MIDMKWRTNRLLVHFVRFAMLVVGLLAVSELLMALLTCQDVKYVGPLRSAGQCAGAVIFYLYVFVPCVLPFHFVPAAFLALAATSYWAWRDRNRSGN